MSRAKTRSLGDTMEYKRPFVMLAATKRSMLGVGRQTLNDVMIGSLQEPAAD